MTRLYFDDDNHPLPNSDTPLTLEWIVGSSQLETNQLSSLPAPPLNAFSSVSYHDVVDPWYLRLALAYCSVLRIPNSLA